MDAGSQFPPGVLAGTVQASQPPGQEQGPQEDDHPVMDHEKASQADCTQGKGGEF